MEGIKRAPLRYIFTLKQSKCSEILELFAKMCTQRAFALVLLAVAMCCGHDQTYCGRSLARAIAMFCYEAGNGQQGGKRSDGTMYNSILAPHYKDQDEPQYGWVWPPYKARAISLPSRGKRLVVNECCDKPCSVAEIMSYCDY